MKLEVFSPYDKSKVGELELENIESANKKLELLYSFFQGKSTHKKLKKFERLAILEKIIELLKRDYDKIINIAISEGGKPKKDTIIEMDRAIDGVKIAIATLRSMSGQEIPMELTPSSQNRYASYSYEPIGVIYALSAFNHPINLIIHQVIPAFAVGSPVLIKPAPATPLTCDYLVKLFYEAGVPEYYLQQLICDNDVAGQIVSDNRIAYLSFIGSAAVGWQLSRKLHNGVRFGLEHGGIAPVIIADDIQSDEDILRIAKSIAKGGYYHSGQVCVSTQRVFIPRNISDSFVEKLTEIANNLKVGNPNDEDTDLGPVINLQSIERIDNWVKLAILDKNANCKLAFGENKIGDTCYAPTLLINPSKDALVSTNEIFGPVVCLYEYDDINEAINWANNSEFVFHSALFTNDLNSAFDLSEKLNGTGIMVNDHTAFRTDWMPFGGDKSSGMGIGGINYSMLEYSYKKLRVFNFNR
jgi:acyl-CoA reductase-like NAD-dependent aldehyde dehydrogenase